MGAALCSSPSSDGSMNKGNEKKVNILLLGAPSVGKSTVFRQMKLKYLSGFSPKERNFSRNIIRRNVISALLTLDEAVGKFGLNLESDKAEDAVTKLKLALSVYDDLLQEEEEDDEDSQSPDAKAEGDPSEPFPADAVLVLFGDPAIQRVYQQILSPTSEIAKVGTQARELSGTAMPYFLAKLTEVCSPEYNPSDDDCLHLRRATTGTETIHFKTSLEMSEGRFHPVAVKCKDIGGQAQEQQKWELHAKNVDVVLFVAAVSDFDTILPDGSNSLANQFELLRQIYTAECFSEPQVVVVLNKMDLLSEKLSAKGLKSYFPSFNNVNNDQGAVEFMVEQCENIITETQNLNDDKPPQQANIVPITAFDPDMIENVITKAIASSVTRSLVSIGFMS